MIKEYQYLPGQATLFRKNNLLLEIKVLKNNPHSAVRSEVRKEFDCFKLRKRVWGGRDWHLPEEDE
jgi:hypothetical protein